MYVPPKFAVDEDEAWRIVDEAGAGFFIVATPEGLKSVFVPVILGEDRRVLRFHVARANDWWRGIEDGTDVLGIFLAASAYVPPAFYPSRATSPNVVPTWNYVAVELRGRVSVHDDPQWKLGQVSDLTAHFERGIEPEFVVAEMDETYRSAQLRGIVGVEVEVLGIEGKEKLSQNRPDEDRLNVRAQFARRSLTEQHVARWMADE